MVVSYYFFILMVTAIPDPVSFQDFVEKFMDGEGMKSFFPFLNSFKVNATRQMTSLGIIFFPIIHFF